MCQRMPKQNNTKVTSIQVKPVRYCIIPKILVVNGYHWYKRVYEELLGYFLNVDD